jgi:hypothetical protein
MRRPFPVLASIVGLLLVASLARAPGEDAGRLGLAAGLATVAVHGLVCSSLRTGRRRVEATAARLGLPDWVVAQAEKNRAKAAVLAATGVPLAILSIAALGLRPGSGWRVGLAAFNLAFQVGAFAGEYLAIAAQARLSRDLAGWPGGASVS